MTVTTTVPGQNVRLTFTGAAGQSVSLQLAGVTIANGIVSFLRPDGATLAIKAFAAGTTFVDPVVLPSQRRLHAADRPGQRGGGLADGHALRRAT